MAVKKAASGTKKKDGGAAKKAGAVKKAAAPKKAAAAATKTAAAPKKAAATKTATTTKKAAVKKAGAAPAKLSASQADLLQKIGSAGEAGYRSEKKAEQRTIDSLQEKKLIKRGAKHKESGTYHYMISNAGKKHLSSQPAPTPSAGGAAGSSSPAGGGGA